MFAPLAVVLICGMSLSIVVTQAHQRHSPTRVALQPTTETQWPAYPNGDNGGTITSAQHPCLESRFGRYCGNCTEHLNSVSCIGCVWSQHGIFCGDNCICHDSGCRCGPNGENENPSQPPCLESSRFGWYCGGNCTEYPKKVSCTGCVSTKYGFFCSVNSCNCRQKGCSCS